jgi:hypothetical protein
MSNILGGAEEVLGTLGAPLLENIKENALQGFINQLTALAA